MTRRTARTAVALLTAAIAGGAEATSGSRLVGFGPVQEAMGGAAVGAPLDPATQVTNPAGLVEVPGRALLAATRAATSVAHVFDGRASEETEHRGYLPAVGVALAVGERTVVGVGAWQTQRVGGEDRPDPRSFSVTRYSGSVAHRITDRLSVGVTANVQHARAILADWAIAAESHGVSAGAGALFRVSEALALGLALESPGWFGSIETTRGGPRAELSTPPLAAVGVGWRPVRGLVVAADAALVLWSAANGKGSEYDLSEDAWIEEDLGWRDQVVLKLGAEYRVASALEIRGGVSYGELPSRSGPLPYAGSTFHFTAGAGLELSRRVALDVSFAMSPEERDLAPRYVPVVDYWRWRDARQWSTSGGLTFRL